LLIRTACALRGAPAPAGIGNKQALAFASSLLLPEGGGVLCLCQPCRWFKLLSGWKPALQIK